MKEVLSEDPYAIGEMAVQYTLGLQVGEAPQYIKVAGCGKHYAVRKVFSVQGRKELISRIDSGYPNGIN